jgi:hypothetical protein
MNGDTDVDSVINDENTILLVNYYYPNFEKITYRLGKAYYIYQEDHVFEGKGCRSVH